MLSRFYVLCLFRFMRIKDHVMCVRFFFSCSCIFPVRLLTFTGEDDELGWFDDFPVQGPGDGDAR